jgi:hypothetical protein
LHSRSTNYKKTVEQLSWLGNDMFAQPNSELKKHGGRFFVVAYVHGIFLH